MFMSEEQIEKEIQDKGLNAPRLTPALIDSKIKDKAFHVFEGSCLTVCCLTLENGFTVTGESACVSPENFDAEIGETIAFEQARNKIWMLEGYLLKERLSLTSTTFLERMNVEHLELVERMAKLTGGLKSGKVPAEAVADLEEQFIAMDTYRKILCTRIAKANK